MDRIELPCAPADKPVRERLNEPVGAEGEFCVLAGAPYILFRDWDYAEDWSGEFVCTIAPRALEAAHVVTAEEFWRLVRRVHGIES